MKLWVLLKSSREHGAFGFSRQSCQLGLHCKFCLTLCAWWFQSPYHFRSLCCAFGGCLLFIYCSGVVIYMAHFSKPLLCFWRYVLDMHTWPCAQDLRQLTYRNVYPYLASFYANILLNHGTLVETKKLTLIHYY